MIVGIDLGTTNSLIAYYTESGPELIPNVLGNFLTPSVVSRDSNDQLFIGTAARERLTTHPSDTHATFKRSMGTASEFKLGPRKFRAEELSALVLKSLITDAETALGEKVTEAVISVPAYFSDAQRKATRIAGQMAGIKVDRLINEPTAAALAYGLSAKQDGGSFLVFDLGGGTFDVSILEMFDGVIEVHATAGDNYLGGEDFLDVLENACYAELNITPEILSLTQYSANRSRLERLKNQLANSPEATTELETADGSSNWSISEHRFAELCKPLIKRLRTPIEQAMHDAKLSPDDLDEIILVGGASRMSLVPRLVARMFGKLTLRHINPDQVIALGAAVVAGMKSRHENFKEIVMTDVCPYTLGVGVCEIDHNGCRIDGFFSPIIERNSTVPISRVQTYIPSYDYQTKLLVPVFQGESPRTDKNIALGMLEIDLPRLPALENAVDVRFTYDVNGLLQVEAIAKSSQKTFELVIQQQNLGLMTELEIRARLKELENLKIHPRENQANIALQTLAERLYAELLPERHLIQQQLIVFLGALETQDLKRIDKARKSFAQFLDNLEHSKI